MTSIRRIAILSLALLLILGGLAPALASEFPPGEFILGFGILPAVPRQMLPLARQLLKTASDLSMRVGGKRYLSGWVEFTPEQWKSHFGETWEDLLRWKRFYDPAGIMNPGFIPYPDRSESSD